MSSVERTVEAAWDALDRGEPERAVELCGALPEDCAERWRVECSAWTELGELARAGAALARGRALGLGPDDPDWLFEGATLALRSWKLDEARRGYEALLDTDAAADCCDRLALIAELEGDLARADALQARATRADPGAFPPIRRLGEAAFERVVQQAIERMPDEFRALLEETEVIVAPAPTPELVVAGREAETPPDLLGLFCGPSRLELADSPGAEPTPVVYLFQRNLERACEGEDDLCEQIAVTLYHEFGHLLGFDEQGVDDLGLG